MPSNIEVLAQNAFPVRFDRADLVNATILAAPIHIRLERLPLARDQ